MRGRIDWRNYWNVVTLGRLIGLAIIVVGIVLAAFDASAAPDVGQGSHYELRFFIRSAVGYVWQGGLVLVVAEIGDRFGWGAPSGTIDWNAIVLLKLIGVAVIVVGILLTLWDVKAIHDAHDGGVGQMSRYFVRGAIYYVFDGALVVLLAEVANRMDWRSHDDDVTPADVGPAVEEVATP